MASCFPFPVPNPPLNISRKIVHLNQRGLASSVLPDATPFPSRKARDVPLIEEQQQEEEETRVGGEEVTSEEALGGTVATRLLYNLGDSVANGTDGSAKAGVNDTAEEESVTRPYWPDPTGSPPPTEDEFVNAVVTEYEDSVGASFSVRV